MVLKQRLELGKKLHIFFLDNVQMSYVGKQQIKKYLPKATALLVRYYTERNKDITQPFQHITYLDCPLLNYTVHMNF